MPFYYMPRSLQWGHYVLTLSVSLSVLMSVACHYRLARVLAVTLAGLLQHASIRSGKSIPVPIWTRPESILVQ